MITNTSQQAAILGGLLLQQGKKITAAESCTGGGIAQAITQIPGCSAWFEVAWVTYSNAMKTQLLGVPEAVLQREGAVSEATVRAMHAGALALSGADIAVAVSGVAGPGGGSADKPLGTVFIAWGDAAQCLVAREGFSGDRQAVREQATGFALQRLNHFLQAAVST